MARIVGERHITRSCRTGISATSVLLRIPVILVYGCNEMVVGHEKVLGCT